MDSIVDITKSAAGLSTGALALIKKIPLLGDIVRYQERKEQTEQVVHEKFLNEYRILNDPMAQTAFINSFSNEDERKAIVGHIIDVQSNGQKSLNIVSVLNKYCENVASADEKEVDDKQMDPDWWMLWLDHAKMTSNPQKQEILAKALELENKKQGTISARFIRVLGDMSSDELLFFKDVSKYFAKGGYLYSSVNSDFFGEELVAIDFDKKKKLESLFVARFSTGIGEYRTFTNLLISGKKGFFLWFDGFTLIIWKDIEKIDVQYSMSLTPEGLLLKRIIGQITDLNYVKEVAKKISERMSCKVSVHSSPDDARISKFPLVSFMCGEEIPSVSPNG